MSDSYGLTPPWDTDQAALNAAEIMSEVKAGTGKYRELDDARLTCECTSSRKVIARVFVGQDDDGVVRAWLWVPAVRSGKDRPASPSLCTHLPQEVGEAVVPMTAICPRCKSGFLLIPGVDGPGTVRQVALDTPTYGTVEG